MALLEKIPNAEDIKFERYFQIRDIDSKGCGSFKTFCVTQHTSDKEIGEIASQLWTEEMERRERFFILSFFNVQPKWRNIIKVYEQSREIVKLKEVDSNGRDYRNKWSTKRKGLKFTIENNWIRMKMSDGTTKQGNGYSFGEFIN